MVAEARFEARTRTYQYLRPAPEQLRAAALDGLELLQRVMDGQFPMPPMAATLGFTLVAVERGRAIFEGTAAEWQYNPLGSVHGGWIATILDSALGCAVHSSLSRAEGYTSTDLQVRFLRAVVTGSGVLRAEAHVVHTGKRIATAEARLFGRDDSKLYATATGACLVLAP